MALLPRSATETQRPREVLKSGDFAKLEVSKALLAKHDAKQALYVQAAAYLDAHSSGSGKAATTLATKRAEAAPAHPTKEIRKLR